MKKASRKVKAARATKRVKTVRTYKASEAFRLLHYHVNDMIVTEMQENGGEMTPALIAVKDIMQEILEHRVPGSLASVKAEQCKEPFKIELV